MARTAVVVATAAAFAACSDSNVPFYNEPTGVSNTQSGIQNAVSGLFSSSRIDIGNALSWETQFARDLGNIQFDNPENIAFGTGETPIPASDGGPWDNEYRMVGAALNIITAIPNAAPAYSKAQAEALVGIVETMEAENLMVVAEIHDTLGMPIHTAADGGVGPVYCNPDAWKWIVALLDTANDSLSAAGSIALPVKLPTGFGSVSQTAGPSSVAGSFASFNRALAGKAGLELAYAIARNAPAGSGARPTASTPGLPNVAALTRADSAMTASALYSVPLAPPTAGGFSENSAGVYWDWSSISGDQPNPFQSGIGTWQTLVYLVGDVDTLHDARWQAKFVPQPASLPLQITTLAFMTHEDLYDYYPSPSTPMPIIRNETMHLERAQIQLGLGNLAEAITLINDVHQQVGGFASPLSIASTYTAVRDSLLKEQRISTVNEPSGDRTISLRMYGLQAVADTTWSSAAAKAANEAHTDLHTTILPVPVTEIEGRGGTYNPTCP
jgi:starch-binding outer membrane protein, SusD/RagB family